MNVCEALGVTAGARVALVGGGGKTTLMFRLAAEVVAAGGQAIATTTTRIFAAQIGLAPVYLAEAAATTEAVGRALADHGQVLITGPVDEAAGKATAVSLATMSRLAAEWPHAVLVAEADGSRMRPFKAPAEHEPVIAREATLVVWVVGADVFGRALEARSVHRPEVVAALAAAPLNAPITPQLVAAVAGHPLGGLKGVPPEARFWVAVNKVETLPDWAAVDALAAALAAQPRVTGVAALAAQTADPVRAIYEHGVRRRLA